MVNVLCLSFHATGKNLKVKFVYVVVKLIVVMANIHWLQGQKIARLILWMSVIVLQMLNPVTSLEGRPST